ncbi:5'-AMP-activated protein kinase-related [Heracleum sosnowskyi]|uniref:5'-AMP-activated protein kinase-related n=1 Tax=Heracleum sosnowskyi TaxID=360622 RepID=A0AAD8M6D9_9APIA|nr:5'-AMP-activated protein kinase-related [Heracleum sosnowskyi]
MATLFHFPAFFSFSPHKNFSCTPPLKIYRCPSSQIPTISASFSKKPRVRKKVRSNEDLCNDIREFLLEFRFPEDHLPSFKELSDHGRQDLAYIVRRRGYKLIKELLATSVNTKTVEDDIAGIVDRAAAVNTNQQDEVENLAEAVHLSSKSPIEEDDFNDIAVASEFHLDENIRTLVESSNESALQEKVANFIQNGELNMIEDSVFDILRENVAEGQAVSEFEDATELELSSNETDAAETLHRNNELLSQQVEPSTSISRTREDCVSTGDGLSSADYSDDSDIETRKKENEVEISRLKFMLHQKELELSELKQHIEKEKLALSLLQSRAEKEISTAQKLVSDKDSELQAAEQALVGLQEVQLQYEGAGESVEVAGSFNGWHQRIKMDPQPSSTPSIVDVMRRRSFTLWRTVLWLYPGTYEIKFIVDDHWKIDPERETVTRGTIHNNILRVN